MKCWSWKALYTSITILNLLIHFCNSYTCWITITEIFDIATVCLGVSQCFTVRICFRDNMFTWINRLIFRILVNNYFRSAIAFIFIISIILFCKILFIWSFCSFSTINIICYGFIVIIIIFIKQSSKMIRWNETIIAIAITFSNDYLIFLVVVLLAIWKSLRLGHSLIDFSWYCVILFLLYISWFSFNNLLFWFSTVSITFVFIFFL